MAKLMPVLLLAVGGAAGTLARVGLAALVQKAHGGPWPWGTLVVNALGCLLFGTLWGVFNLRLPHVSPLWSLALLGGFCGAFTTFSTFAFETHRLSGDAPAAHALGYLLLSNVAGLALVWVGAEHLARLWLPR
ncbi:MAG: CrcB family protein [Planctomycetota bacterium]